MESSLPDAAPLFVYTKKKSSRQIWHGDIISEMTNRKFKDLSLYGAFKASVFAITHRKCNNSNSNTSSISFLLHRWERTSGKMGNFPFTDSYFAPGIHTFFSIESALSKSAISPPLLMISLLPVTLQYICRAIHLSILSSRFNSSQWSRSWKGEPKPLAARLSGQPASHRIHFMFWMTDESVTPAWTSMNLGKSAGSGC